MREGPHRIRVGSRQEDNDVNNEYEGSMITMDVSPGGEDINGEEISMDADSRGKM